MRHLVFILNTILVVMAVLLPSIDRHVDTKITMMKNAQCTASRLMNITRSKMIPSLNKCVKMSLTRKMNLLEQCRKTSLIQVAAI